jgi:hypothetical protein
MRMGWIVMLMVTAMVAVGCKHQTPEQKEQARLQKEQAAEDKAVKKQAEADAKAEQKRLAEQAKADKKEAQEQARAMKKHTPDAMREQAMAKADYYPDDRLKVIGYPDILPENHQHWIDKHAQAMAAAGASYEAMLYEIDFHGDELSASGRNRLRLMMKDPPATIYVATTGGNDAQKQARFNAITKYWQEISASQIAVKEGVNDEVSSPAGAGLSALQRMEKASPKESGQNINMRVTNDQPSTNSPSSP